MKGLHLIDIHRLNSGEKLVLPALCLNVPNAQELQMLLHHCTPTQPLMLFHQETYLFEGQKSELSHFDWAYPLHVYLADPVRESYRHLVDIVAQLRHPETGCPWDLAQTSLSLTPYIVEEAYEAVHAIGTGDVTAIQEELGDLLLQVVLQAQIAQEQGNFSLVEVANGISKKLIRRHPHVFGKLAVDDVAVVRRNWEAIKQQDQGHSITEKLHHYMATFPALIAAAKIYQKLSAHSQAGSHLSVTAETLMTQLQNLVHQPNTPALGQFLFALVAWATAHDLDSNLALTTVNQSLVQQYALTEAEVGQENATCEP